MKTTFSTLSQNLRKFFEKTGFQKAVLGLSGGIDSALTLAIAVEALGKENVTAVLMPEKVASTSANLEDAKMLAEQFGISYFVEPIDDFLKPFRTLHWDSTQLAEMNIRARSRMMILYHFANVHNALVLGTGNKTEILIGYGTKYGDFGVDVEVIGTLYKTEVFAMAKEIGLPETFYTKAPSAELHAGQTDEEEIGASYATIDRILQNMLEGKIQTDDETTVKNIVERVAKNKHKTEVLPMIQRI